MPPVVSCRIGEAAVAPPRQRVALQAVAALASGRAYLPAAPVPHVPSQPHTAVAYSRWVGDAGGAGFPGDSSAHLQACYQALGCGYASPSQQRHPSGQPAAGVAATASPSPLELYCTPQSPIPHACLSSADRATAPGAAAGNAPPSAEEAGHGCSRVPRYPPLERTIWRHAPAAAARAWSSVLCGLATGEPAQTSRGELHSGSLPSSQLDCLAPPPLVRLWRFSSDDAPPGVAQGGNTAASAAGAGSGRTKGSGTTAAGAGVEWVRVPAPSHPRYDPLHSFTLMCSQDGTVAVGQSLTQWA